MSITPVADQTQLSSGVSGTRRYLLSTTSCSHSTREKLMRHWSPSLGGKLCSVTSLSDVQGIAISTVHPLSTSDGSLTVPATETAVRRPWNSQPLSLCPPAR